MRYNLGDLGDLYRDEMTLRQVWVRFWALPPDAPLLVVLRAEQEKAEADQRSADLDDALTRYRKG